MDYWGLPRPAGGSLPPQLAVLLGPARALPAGAAAFGGPALAAQPAAASPPVHRKNGIRRYAPHPLLFTRPPTPFQTSLRRPSGWAGHFSFTAARRASSKWPSDVQGWPKARPRRFAPQGRADLRAPKRSAASGAQRRPQNIKKREKNSLFLQRPVFLSLHKKRR